MLLALDSMQCNAVGKHQLQALYHAAAADGGGASPHSQHTARPRVGHIQFLNCLPIHWGLARTGALSNNILDLHKDTPDNLSTALVAGDLDLGPISLVEYLRNADKLLLLPDLAVGSNGPVLSVNVVSTRPLQQLDGRSRVALGSTSRTGALLAQMLLAQRYGVRPTYFSCAPDLDRMLLQADAAVLIGDVALHALRYAPSRKLFVTDLGQAWKEWTGLPMVFAVWAVRRDFAAAHLARVQEVHGALLRARDLCLTELDAVAEAASAVATVTQSQPLDVPTLAAYFRAIDFSLGEQQVVGLREFAGRAAAMGAAPALPASGPVFLGGCSASMSFCVDV